MPSRSRRLGCLKALVADDLHWGPREERRYSQLLSYMVVDLVFATYGYVFHEFYPEARAFSRCVWMPHSASPDFLVPFNADAENAIFLSGAISAAYPLREQMQALCEAGRHRIVHHPHPGYGTHFDNDCDPRVGRGYGRLLNGYRAAFTDSLIYRYTVAKHFEIPATARACWPSVRSLDRSWSWALSIESTISEPRMKTSRTRCATSSTRRTVRRLMRSGGAPRRWPGTGTRRATERR